MENNTENTIGTLLTMLFLKPFYLRFSPLSLSVFTLPNMPFYARLFRGAVPAFTLPEVNYLLELALQFTLLDPAHIGGLLG